MALKFTNAVSNKPGDLDKRYRITVMLVADRRPRYWTLHCNHCGTKVTELSGDQVAISDIFDLNTIPEFAPAPQITRCPSKYCNFWYEVVNLSPNTY